MAAEEPDTSDPASFYVAGAQGWDDPQIAILRARQRQGQEEDHLYPTPEALAIEE